ncbi:MAG: hypothetical protein AAF740_07145 [Bacteroidota bacterium]
MKSLITETQIEQWRKIENFVESQFGKKPDMQAILFLIGVQELGQGFRQFSKEEKQDLMHIAICRVLHPAGYYHLEGQDQDGWPHWKPTEKIPHLNFFEQEGLLKLHIIQYFEDEIW